MPETQDLGLGGGGGCDGDQFADLRDFTQRVQQNNTKLHSAGAAENAARAKILPEVSALLGGKRRLEAED